MVPGRARRAFHARSRHISPRFSLLRRRIQLSRDECFRGVLAVRLLRRRRISLPYDDEEDTSL
jgi:hypothetical protein